MLGTLVRAVQLYAMLCAAMLKCLSMYACSAMPGNVGAGFGCPQKQIARYFDNIYICRTWRWKPSQCL
jgi:hypothetical protein